MSATHWVRSYQYADDDTGEAVRLARECLDLGQCTARGTHASALGLSHGASWIRLIAHCLTSGGGLLEVQTTVLVLLLVSGVLSFLVARRYGSARTAPLVFLFYLQPVVATSRFVELSNTTLLPLALALYYASVALCVESGSALAAIVAAVCLAAAMSAHISCVLMVPFHLALVLLFARRPIAAVALASLSFVVAFTVESYDAARAVAGLIVATPAVVGAIVLAAIVLGASAARFGRLGLRTQQLRGRLAEVPRAARVRAVMKAAIVYINSTVWIGSALARSSIPDSHYLVPLVFPLVFLAADSATQLSRRATITLSMIGILALLLFPFAPVGSELGNVCMLALSALVAVAIVARLVGWRGVLARVLGPDPFSAAPAALAFGLAALALAASVPDLLIVPRERQTWPVGAAERLADDLYESGFTFPRLWAALQRQSPGTVEYTMAILDPNLFHQPEPVVDAGWSLLALMVEPAVVARTAGVVLTFPINATRSAIVVRAPSYLDRTHVRTCYSSVCGAQPPPERCTERQPERPLRHLPPYFEVDREEPVVGTTFSFLRLGQKYCILFSIPLHTSGSRVPHIVRVSEQWPLHVRIRRVEGVDVEGPLPGAEVRLVDDRAATGSMEVEVSSDGLGPLSNWLEEPPLIEVTAANEHLLQPFRERRASLR